MQARRVFPLAIAAAVLVVGAVAALANTSPNPAVEARQEAADPIFSDTTNEQSKEEIQAENDALAAIGDAYPDESSHTAPPPIDMSDEPWGSGISDGGSEFPLNNGFAFNETIWEGDSNGSHIRVYAGSYSEKRETGVLLVEFVNPKTWDHKFEQYSEDGTGSFTIESADGNVLRLKTSNGGSVSFDVDALSFSS
jgi:hypothetical protein